MQETKVADYGGWEIHHASPTAFSIRRGGQTVGPYATEAEARAAIDAEEGKGNTAPLGFERNGER
jgi:hypothetical protein